MPPSSSLQKYSLLILSLLLFPLLVTAGDLRQADAEDLERLYRAATTANSAYRATYIGEASGRVYIEYVTAIHTSSLVTNESKTVVYWFPQQEMDPKLLQEMIHEKEQAMKRQQNASE